MFCLISVCPRVVAGQFTPPLYLQLGRRRVRLTTTWLCAIPVMTSVVVTDRSTVLLFMTVCVGWLRLGGTWPLLISMM